MSVLGTWDFFGLNHYTTRLVSSPKSNNHRRLDPDVRMLDVVIEVDETWSRFASIELYGSVTVEMREHKQTKR